MATTKLMCTQIKKQVGIILKKTAGVPEKKSPSKPVNRFASATWIKFCEKLSCATKTNEEKKINVPSKKSTLHEQNLVKNYHCAIVKKKKEYLSVK